MDYVTLGRTEIKVCKNGFGALPIQRISFDSAKEILLHAYNSGINFFDTARFYTDSEEKIGYALSDVRDKIYIATKTAAQNADDFWKDLNTSLNNMKTDYIDIYQFHNPSFCPKPNDGTGLYRQCLRQKHKAKFVLSVLQITVLQSHKRLSTPDFTTQFSSRSAILQRTKILR